MLAIATGGTSPALAKKLREELSAEFGEEWAGVLDVVHSVRAETGRSISSLAERARRWAAALDLDEAARLVREGRADELAARLRARLTSEETTTR